MPVELELLLPGPVLLIYCGVAVQPVVPTGGVAVHSYIHSR